MRLVDVGAWAALLALFALRLSYAVVDLDLFHQLALARESLALRAIPHQDVYAFTPTLANVVHHEWGAGFIAYAAVSAFGGAGVLGLKWLLAGSTAAICVREAFRRGADKALVWCVSPIALTLLGLGYANVRAHAYSLLFAAVTVACLERERAGRRSWMVPYALLFVAWVNLHGGFVVGLLLIAAHAFEAALRRERFWPAALFCLALAPLVIANPFGSGYVRYLAGALTMSRAAVGEWRPIWAEGSVFLTGGFVIALLLFAYGVHAAGARSARGALLILGTAAASVAATRFLPFFAIAWLIHTPALLTGSRVHSLATSATTRHPAPAAVAWALVAALLFNMAVAKRPWVLRVPNSLAEAPGHTPIYPVGAVNFMRASGFVGNVMTPFEHGAYVSWKLYPSAKVSVDSRYEAAYDPSLVDEMLAFYRGAIDPARIVAKYPADVVLIPRYSTLKPSDIGWATVYADDGFVLVARPTLRQAWTTSHVSMMDSVP